MFFLINRNFMELDNGIEKSYIKKQNIIMIGIFLIKYGVKKELNNKWIKILNLLEKVNFSIIYLFIIIDINHFYKNMHLMGLK